MIHANVPHTDGCRTLAEYGGICGRLPDGTPDCVAESSDVEDEAAVAAMDHRDRRERAVGHVAAQLRRVRHVDPYSGQVAVTHPLRAENDAPVWRPIQAFAAQIVDYAIGQPFTAHESAPDDAVGAALAAAHSAPAISACGWHRPPGMCTCPAWDIVERLNAAGLLVERPEPQQ